MIRIREKSKVLLVPFFVLTACNESRLGDTTSNDNYTEEKEYYENGILKYKGEHLDGKKEGKHTWYFENGLIEIIAEYHNDTLDGEYLSYDEKGVLRTKAFNKKGVLEGELIEYYPNGEIQLKSEYKNGVNHKTVYYDSLGMMSKESKYIKIDGRDIVSSIIFYDSNGKILADNSSGYKTFTKPSRESNIFSLGEIVTLFIEVFAHDAFKVSYIRGEFNDNFKFINENSKKRYFSDKRIIDLPLVTSEKGEHIIRLIIDLYIELDDGKKEVHPIFVEYKYWVE